MIKQMKNKVIEFSTTHPYLPMPKPAKLYVPDWYKKAPHWGNDNNLTIRDYNSNAGMKYCMPFQDSLTAGYMIELWCDIQVTQIEGTPSLNWMVDPDPVKLRPHDIAPTLPTPYGYSDDHFIWNNPYSMRLPKGYSAFLTHPVNRYDLPFISLTGFVDADEIMPSWSPTPFFIKKDFEGIIPAGTPIYQIIPVKRDSWSSKVTPELETISQKIHWLGRRSTNGLYRATRWHKKVYQ